MSRLKLFARCATTLLPLLLMLAGGVVQSAHLAEHLAHPHSAARHVESADSDWDGHCIVCRHAETTTPVAARSPLLVAAPPAILPLPTWQAEHAGFTTEDYPPLAARPPPALA